MNVNAQEPVDGFHGTIRSTTRIVNFSNVNAQEPIDGFHGTIRSTTRIVNFSNVNAQEPVDWFHGTIRSTTRIVNFSNVNAQEPVDGFHGTIRSTTRIVNFSNVNAQEPIDGFHGTIRLNRQYYTLVDFLVPPRALIIILNKARGDQEPGLSSLWIQRFFSIIKGGRGISLFPWTEGQGGNGKGQQA